MRVVALVPGGIGDQILFFPTLDDLKRNYPEAEIDVVVEPRAVGAYRVCKSVSETLRYDFPDRNSLADLGNLLGTLRDREYDVAISWDNSWIIGLLLWMTGISKRIGCAASPGKMFLTSPVALKTEQYAASMYHDLLPELDINTPCPELAISVPKQDIDWAEAEQKRLGIDQSGYVLIYGGASEMSTGNGSNEIYPIEKWREIIRDFQKRQPDMSVVVVQGTNNVPFVSQLLQSFSNLKVTTPGDIGKLAAIIAGANLMLCRDSAAMHLGVAVQTYTIALFGCNDPKKVLPQSDRILSIKSPTGNIADISPQEVIQKVWGG